MLHVTMFSQYSAMLVLEYFFGHGYSKEKRASAYMWHSCRGAHAGLPDAIYHSAIHFHTTFQPSAYFDTQPSTLSLDVEYWRDFNHSDSSQC